MQARARLGTARRPLGPYQYMLHHLRPNLPLLFSRSKEQLKQSGKLPVVPEHIVRAPLKTAIDRPREATPEVFTP